MKRFHSLSHLMGLMLFTLSALVLCSCAGSQDQVYNTWIDYPRQGDQFQSGEPVPITIHIEEQENLAEVIIHIGDEVIYKGPPPPSGDPVMVLSQEWIPDQPGEYTIEVDVINNDGRELQRALVDFIVIGELEVLKPDLAITDIKLVGTDQIECHYANFGAAVLPEGRDVWLDIILGPAESELPPISRMNIGTGSNFPPGTTGWVTTNPVSPAPTWPHLVTCRIDVDGQVTESDETNNSLALTLATTPPPPPAPPTTEPPPPTTQPPPPPTTQPPPPPPSLTPTTTDSTPPTVSNLTANPDRIATLPCGQNTTTISAQVSDPSGISQVKLFYRAVKGGTAGSWQSQNMIHEGGNSYLLSVGPAQISASYDPYGGMNLEYYVKAWDGFDNFSESSTGSLPLDHCVQ